MPDALETAAEQDTEFARTGQLVGPLQGVVVAIKDQYDTFDMRTTNGADVAYANDRPPRDSTVVARLRKAGAIILAKANRGGYQLAQRVRRHGLQSRTTRSGRRAARARARRWAWRRIS